MTFLYPLIVLLTAVGVCAVHARASLSIRPKLHGKYTQFSYLISGPYAVTVREQRDWHIDPRDIPVIEAVRRRCTRVSVGLMFGGFGVMMLISAFDSNANHRPSCSAHYNPAAICGSK